MGVDYVKEKLLQALLSMATDLAPLNMRLAHGFTYFLATLRPEDFPKSLRFKYRRALKLMTREQPQGDEGSFVTSARALHLVEAQEVADLLRKLYDSIEWEDERERVARQSDSRNSEEEEHGMTLVDLTYSILEVNMALDTGDFDDIAVEEVREKIESGEIFDFLTERLGRSIDLGLLDGKKRSEITEELQALSGAYGSGRKWGVKNRGLCLMIAWLNELIQQRKFQD